ncbi:basic 7S globulin-like [Pyrus ussuriensis x Pyrus communis]|uniref:Basic 7S globulin-like n=1 Tax=Pyrus ussuriensis x Pyrus communis TaxID=2448454 RepID=A0A5N5HFF4_9ROSA|nr:basic 7S globulin-like [Pyrus ussuriensis x Pyrus communis]
MASSSFHCLLFCSSLFHFFVVPSLAKTASFRPKALVLPVAKDSSTLQYLTTFSQRTPFVPIKLTVDLGGRYLWGGLRLAATPPNTHSQTPKSCTTECYSSPKPGCNNTCALSPGNTITRTSTGGDLGQDTVSLQSTDGSNPGRLVSVPNLLFTCGPTFLLEGLASGVKGMAGLGRDKIGLPSQFASAFSLPRKFAICLSSSSKSSGVVIFGDRPYTLFPNIEVSKSLTFTPLIINPVSTAGAYFQGEPSVGYFINVKSIKVNGKVVALNTSLLAIDNEGYGGTNISTVNPYTVLETSIYNAVVNAFVKEVAYKIPRVKAVAPFGTCFSSKNIGVTRVGHSVPSIDLVLQSESVYWTINDVLCLGFADGGERPRTSIVIGGSLPGIMIVSKLQRVFQNEEIYENFKFCI